jgi:hypothetical protein
MKNSWLVFALLVLACPVWAITLYWQNNSPPDQQDGIKIERQVAPSGVWTQIATTAGSVTSYCDKAAYCWQSFNYRIRAYNAAGDSGYSNTAGPALRVCSDPSNIVRADVP